ncbi:hypothetical protein [Micromonospora maritima]|uniref:hypothetical protein n=1 Tax=Micromonospora maritima TaxID=986711 RepID=UPI0037913DC3
MADIELRCEDERSRICPHVDPSITLIDVRRPPPKANRQKHSAPPPVIADEASEELILHAASLWPKILEQRASLKTIEERLQSKGIDRNLAARGRPAFETLQEVASDLEAKAAEYASRHTYHRLLQRLRLLPPPFYGARDFKSTESYMERREWAEVLAFRNAAPPAELRPIYMANTALINRNNLPDLLKFLEIARTYASIQVLMRCAAKDVPITFKPDALPYVDTSDPMWNLVQQLDQRRGAAGGKYGTIMAGFSDRGHESGREVFALAALTLTDKTSDATYTSWENGRGVRFASFQTGVVRSHIPALMRGLDWYPSSLPSLSTILVTILARASRDSVLDLYVRKYGYVVLPRPQLASLLKELEESPDSQPYRNLFPREHPLTFDRMMDALGGYANLYSGTSVPIMIPAGSDAALLDLWSLSRKTVIDLNMPVTGETQNIRAAHFEAETQRLIDASPWAPPAELRALVGRKIRRSDGSDITDIDAIATRGDIALLINCKNYRLDSFGRATAPQARNIRSQLKQDYADWAIKVEEVRKASQNGKHLSRIAHLVPTILTPDPCFVDPSLTVPGGPASTPPVMALHELEAVLFSG